LLSQLINVGAGLCACPAMGVHILKYRADTKAPLLGINLTPQIIPA
jgi:hypothetical protein